MENDRYGDKYERRENRSSGKFDGASPDLEKRGFHEATPSQIAGWVNSDAVKAKTGDAPKVNDLSSYVHSLQQSGNLSSVASSLETEDGTRVVRDKSGQVKELVFDPLSAKPVYVKLTNGDVSVDGHSSKEIQDANNAYTKAYLAESVKNDASVSPEAKKHVTDLENALIDGDAKSVIAGVKALHGKDKVASEVVARLNKDMSPTQLSWEADGKGGGALKIHDYGLEASQTTISTDGRATSVISDSYSKADGQPIESEKVISQIGKEFGAWQGEEVNTTRSVLNSKNQINDKEKNSAEKLADENDVWDRSFRAH